MEQKYTIILISGNDVNPTNIFKSVSLPEVGNVIELEDENQSFLINKVLLGDDPTRIVAYGTLSSITKIKN